MKKIIISLLKILGNKIKDICKLIKQYWDTHKIYVIVDIIFLFSMRFLIYKTIFRGEFYLEKKLGILYICNILFMLFLFMELEKDKITNMLINIIRNKKTLVKKIPHIFVLIYITINLILLVVYGKFLSSEEMIMFLWVMSKFLLEKQNRYPVLCILGIILTCLVSLRLIYLLIKSRIFTTKKRENNNLMSYQNYTEYQYECALSLTDNDKK